MQVSLHNHVFITLMLGVMPVQNILKSEVRRVVVASRKSVYPLAHIECVVNRYIINFPWESIIQTERSGLSTLRNQCSLYLYRLGMFMF